MNRKGGFLQPLFNSNCELVGWIDSGRRHIFDTEMNWVAFISNNNAWSTETGNWLGPVDGLTCLDHDGHVVAWNPSQVPHGKVHPIRPLKALIVIRPVRPKRPEHLVYPSHSPVTPTGGWSQISWYEWISK